MGAHDYLVTYKEASEAKVRKLWASRVEEDRRESGEGSYAGNATTFHGSIRFFDRLLPSESAACEWVMDNHPKWDGPYACSFYLPSKPGKRLEARRAKAKEKVDALGDKLAAARKKAKEAFAKGRSRLVTCGACESKVRRSYVKHATCPVCQNTLLSPTVEQRLLKLDGKYQAALEEQKEAHKPKPSKKTGWVVGGWAAC